jgi:anti-sigma-K factor RskA
MDMQKIEPLLMDYALGGTSPEVSALIEALQEKDTGVRTEVDQWRSVAALARQTAPAEAAVNVPVFPVRRLKRARRVARVRQAAVWCSALAACLVLGYLVGNAHGDRTKLATLAGQPAGVATVSSIAVNAMGESVPVAAVIDFWSPSRLIALAQRNSNRPIPTPSSWSGFSDPSTRLHSFGG